jgi:hypothetical protein
MTERTSAMDETILRAQQATLLADCAMPHDVNNFLAIADQQVVAPEEARQQAVLRGPLIGHAVELSDACRCGGIVALIGASNGPYCASLHCASCGAPLGASGRNARRARTHAHQQLGNSPGTMPSGAEAIIEDGNTSTPGPEKSVPGNSKRNITGEVDARDRRAIK